VLRQLALPMLTTIAELYRTVDDTFLLTYPELDPHPRIAGTRYYGIVPSSQNFEHMIRAFSV
jgi:hypothetical protein